MAIIRGKPTPMLAANCDIHKLVFPLLGSPKLDGIRAIIMDRVVLSRSLKPIPNMYVQNTFGRAQYNGLDGEFIVGEHDGGAFRRTTSIVMSDNKPAQDAVFHVFDQLTGGPFTQRYEELKLRNLPKYFKIVPQTWIRDANELDVFVSECNDLGYEGVMLRNPDAPYKHGRSTVREGYLLKLKHFVDSEAIVVSVNELMHNENVQEKSETGHMVRSSKKAGMVAGGKMGSLTVREQRLNGVLFDLGSGFTEEERTLLWANRDKVIGKIVKFKFQEFGTHAKPRIPVFLGFRSELDM